MGQTLVHSGADRNARGMTGKQFLVNMQFLMDWVMVYLLRPFLTL
jgi:hypothetical protein